MDPKTEEIKANTLKSLQRMLDYRRQYDQKRAGFYRQYIGQREPQKFPDNVTNRANTFVPYPLSNTETIVSRVMDAFFSFDPWFECDGSTEYDDHAAGAMSMVLYKKLKEANFVDAFETFVRNAAIYGHAGIKVDWNWDYKTVVKPTPVPMMDPRTGQPAINPMTGQPLISHYVPQSVKVPVNRPRFNAIDVYDLLVDPDGGLRAHLTERPFIEMQRENEIYTQATGQPLYDPETLTKIQTHLQDVAPEDWQTVLVRFAEVWDSNTGTCTVMCFGDDKEAMAWKDLRASFRAANLSAYKRKVYEGNDVLWHGPNQFAHQRNPILDTSYIKLPNEVFGIGNIEIISDLNESLCQMVNMVRDNWNLGINRRFAYDTNADIDHDALNLMNVPGGKVPVNGNPNDVISPLPLFTPNAGDYQIMDLYKGMIEMSSGVSDFYSKGAGTPSGNKTATGISSVINESNYRFKLFIRNLEVDILQPLLEMCASMVQQFLTDPEEVLITKNPAGPMIPKWQVIQPQDLIGNFDFNLVAANYATSKEVRQRNLMAFMNIAQQSPYWNQGAGLREIGKVLELPNIDDLLYTDQQVQQMQAAAQEQQQQEMLMQLVAETEAQKEVASHNAEVNPKPAAGGGSSGKAPKTPGRNPSTHAVKNRGGRPPTMQFEGKIPGVSGPTSTARSTGQQHGANALGLEGLHA